MKPDFMVFFLTKNFYRIVVLALFQTYAAYTLILQTAVLYKMSSQTQYATKWAVT